MNKLIVIFTFILIGTNAFSQDYYRNWTVVNNTQKERIALIMANNTYESGGSLVQPIQTAKKLELKLKNEGFDVLIGMDMSRAQMLSVLNDFSSKFTSYEFSMVFYLGHGFQIDGENYLIPVDANPRSKDDVEVQAINVDYVMKKIDNPDIPKVVVLDACRDNPFASNWSSNERSGGSRGFGTVSAPRNAEIFFTTAEGTRVRDDNPYLDFFMEELNQGTCISDIKRTVSKRIYDYNSEQIPASYGQLFDEVCFGTKVNPEPNPQPKPIPKKIDSDGDGIFDDVDNCPNTYGVASNRGCPKEAPNNLESDIWIEKGDEYYSQAVIHFHNEYRKKRNEPSMQRAYSFYKKASDAGNVRGMVKLADMMDKGNGVKRDLEMAERLYFKAIEMGNQEAISLLIKFYADGENSYIRDNDRLKPLLASKLKSNPIYAAVIAGRYQDSYFSARGFGGKNYFEWVRLGADAGAGHSIYLLGIIYREGYGWVDVDLEKSKFHLIKACDLGQEEACEALNK